MGVDREWGVFVSLYGPGTSNGCHMAKENVGKVEKKKEGKKRTLQTCAQFNKNTEEIKKGSFLHSFKFSSKLFIINSQSLVAFFSRSLLLHTIQPSVGLIYSEGAKGHLFKTLSLSLYSISLP